MELLIPGLLLVALMVWASTRIKKTAAAAFDAETIETNEFIIQKPDGFLYVINGDSKYAFEAYSKEYGASGAEEFRQGRVYLTIHDGETVDTIVSSFSKSGERNVEVIGEVIGAKHYRVVETTRTEKEIDFRVMYKLAESGGKVYKLEAVRLAQTSKEFASKLEELVNSFELK